MPDTPGLRDRLRARWFVWRVDASLDGRMPRRRRREIRRELRANLAASAQDHGMRGAIERLGHPTTLARGYVEGTDQRVRWRTGVLAALGTFTVLYLLTLFFLVAFSLGATEVAGSEVSFSYAYEVAPGWGPLVGAGEQTSFEVLLLSPFHLILIALAWVLGARIWRWRPAAR
ncbi:MAG: hypothetical protein JJT89_15095 [Nitriliruptoraceae bacterium]|nr:hypothetical protein [Nitriliruptoraceae bacterium]